MRANAPKQGHRTKGMERTQFIDRHYIRTILYVIVGSKLLTVELFVTDTATGVFGFISTDFVAPPLKPRMSYGG